MVPLYQAGRLGVSDIWNIHFITHRICRRHLLSGSMYQTSPNKNQCIIQVVTCLMLIIGQRWDISTFAVCHFTTVVWREPWKDLQWCLNQMMTHQSMYKLKSSSEAASGTTKCLTHQWKQRRPLQALLQLIPGWVKGRNILKSRKREMSHRAQA